ncbi:BA75_00786T0 [Komagataella pastoris]|uniref:BA75_00786T0 n=1 Tax=Komagataella pastoris TaxID=4922 RepID=A0A1B2J6M3_PICPA|nr:BA75_00786T0 [Komagataella pastoris]
MEAYLYVPQTIANLLSYQFTTPLHNTPQSTLDSQMGDSEDSSKTEQGVVKDSGGIELVSPKQSPTESPNNSRKIELTKDNSLIHLITVNDSKNSPVVTPSNALGSLNIHRPNNTPSSPGRSNSTLNVTGRTNTNPLSGLQRSRSSSRSLPKSTRPYLSANNSNSSKYNNDQFMRQEMLYLRKVKDADNLKYDYYNKGIGSVTDVGEEDYDDESGAETEAEIEMDHLAINDPSDKRMMLQRKKSAELNERLSPSLDTQLQHNKKMSIFEGEKQSSSSLFNMPFTSELLTKLKEDNGISLFNLALPRSDNIMDGGLENSLSLDHNAMVERMEWQSMLNSVLTGDIVKAEKTKLIVPANEVEGESYLHATYKENLWLGIRSKIFCRTEAEQKRLIYYSRGLADETINEILQFKVHYPDSFSGTKSRIALEQVTKILDKFEAMGTLWRTHKEMCNEKPMCASPEFESRINALNAWKNITEAGGNEAEALTKWVGNDDLDILRSGSTESTIRIHTDTLPDDSLAIKSDILRDNRSFVERVLKEKDLSSIFEKRLFSSVLKWITKAKESYLEFRKLFQDMNLPSYMKKLLELALFPANLIKELIRVRLRYARKLKNPTLMMIDQMIEDFRLYIGLACDIRTQLMEYCYPQEGWVIENVLDPSFDQTILDCVHYYLVLLNRKLLDSSRSYKTFRTFKEPEELEKQWFSLQNVGFYVEGGGLEISIQFTTLTSKLVHRLLAYLQFQIQEGPVAFTKSELIRWYTTTTENFGALRRKLLRFTNVLDFSFRNASVYKLDNYRNKKFLSLLKDTNHVLVRSETFEKYGIHLIVSEHFINKPSEVIRVLKGAQLGVDFQTIPPKHFKVLQNYSEYFDYMKSKEASSDSEDDTFVPSDGARKDQSPGYVLVICFTRPTLWEGKYMELDTSSIPVINVEPGNLMLISDIASSNLNIAENAFLDIAGESIGEFVERRCSLDKVYHEFLRIRRSFYKMTCTLLDSVAMLRGRCKRVSNSNELMNTIFIYMRDFGNNSLQTFSGYRKPALIMKLIQISIEWLSFIVDECSPTAQKTFKWSVLALEFAMEITRDFNILAVSDEDFVQLKNKVAGCMSLLISHFDIMGARSTEMQRKRIMNWRLEKNENLEMYGKDDAVLNTIRKDMLTQIEEIEKHRHQLQSEQQSVGRVLDDTDTDNQYLTFLSSSFSSVSIRWQKGKFIGGGSFGSVYASINLDTGGVMAVKEIRFQDVQSIRKVVPQVKEEMTVLEMLSHPNIVQYFGVEVHRDRVYIFMEYCEGGSLAGLLEHGRIEDEMVIQVYTLQMLEGVAYLHKSGIVHRDIKPENVLLDHMGVIKFVDFGAAKVIAQERTQDRRPSATRKLNSLIGTPMYLSPEVILGNDQGKHGSLDIWSLGCCVLEMATGRRPWANIDNEFAIMYQIASGSLPQFPSPDQLSEAGCKFLANCLEKDPYKRLTAVELLNDPWIMAIRDEALGESPSEGSSDHGE